MSWWPFSGSKDATSQLTPDLRKFLDSETEQQKQQELEKRKVEQQPRRTYRSALGLDSPGLTASVQTNEAKQDAPLVPAESQFRDGRYADLWKTYQSPQQLSASVSTDQDRLADVLGNYKDRQAAIGRAAVENCVMEQLAQHDCLSGNSYSKLLTLCREEGRAFSRCYEMQSRFLRALGYLSQPRSVEEEERIQMHSDKLYHEMLEREQRMKEAKDKGEDVSPSAPLIRAEETERALGKASAWARMRQQAAENNTLLSIDMLPAAQQAQVVEKLKGMSEDEKAIELQLLAAEYRVAEDLQQTFKDLNSERQKSREERTEEGKQTFGDRLMNLWSGSKT